MCFIVYAHPRAQLRFSSKQVSFLKPTNPCIFMPRISQENKQYYKSRIRSVLAQSSQITPTANQIMGIVGAVSRRWDIRNGTFQYYYLFLIEAVGTERFVPEATSLVPVDRSHRLSKLLFAIHPPTASQFHPRE
jgi:hypothetical protein